MTRVESRLVVGTPPAFEHRWICTCGRYGIWLRQSAAAEKNAALHAAYHVKEMA